MDSYRLSDLNPLDQQEVESLHEETFPNTDLNYYTTHVFYDKNDSLVGFAEIGSPSPGGIANGIYLKKVSELNNQESHVCNGLYLKYINVKDELRGQGLGKKVLEESVALARKDKNFYPNMTSSVLVLVEYESDSNGFFENEDFHIIGDTGDCSVYQKNFE